jgi:hypothetical protein
VVAMEKCGGGRRDGSPTSRPAPEGLDPLRSLRRWNRNRQLKKRDRLPSSVSRADDHYLLPVGQVDALDRNADAEDIGLKGRSRLSSSIE